MDRAEKEKLIQEILKPFKVDEGCIWTAALYRRVQCTKLVVDVDEDKVRISYQTTEHHYEGVYSNHTTYFSTFGYNRCPNCFQFCMDICDYMESKWREGSLWVTCTYPKRIYPDYPTYRSIVDLPKPKLKSW